MGSCKKKGAEEMGKEEKKEMAEEKGREEKREKVEEIREKEEEWWEGVEGCEKDGSRRK